MYFEQLLFLIPLTQQHVTSSNYSPLTGNSGEGTDERKENAHGSIGGTSKTSTCQKKQHKSNNSRKVNYKQQLLDILKEKSEHNDNDKTFLLSLISAFKKLNDKQKYWAKEMLGIMRKAKNMVFQP